MGPLHFAIILGCAALISAQFQDIGKCPDIETVKKFDVAKYEGLWHEIQVVFGMETLPGKCVTARYTKIANGTVEVINTMCILDNKVRIVGNAEEETKDSLKDGKLGVNFPVTGTTARSSYYVLDTDYDTYSIVYSCRESGTGAASVRSRNLWVLGKDTKFNDTIKTKITQKLKVLGLDSLPLKDTVHTNCCYDATKIDDDNSAASIGFSMALLLSTLMVRFL